MRGLAIVVALGATALAAPTSKSRARAKTHHAIKHAKSRFETPSDAAATPAVTYGALSPEACETELGNRHIGFTKETARGVLDPIRLTGALHGVEFRSDEGDARRAESPYEIADCRLVLAMDDFAQILEQHDIVEVRHYSMYRPPPKTWADDRIGGQHNGALALDAGRFTKRDGTVLDVSKDFHGKIGAPTCGDGAGPHPATASAKELREILCSTVAAHLFNVVLTPDFNRPHRNHFHLEVMANVKWFLVH
ncbi:MAG: extensin family protein [Kofleriaceae bacterium]